MKTTRRGLVGTIAAFVAITKGALETREPPSQDVTTEMDYHQSIITESDGAPRCELCADRGTIVEDRGPEWNVTSLEYPIKDGDLPVGRQLIYKVVPCPGCHPIASRGRGVE